MKRHHLETLLLSISHILVCAVQDVFKVLMLSDFSRKNNIRVSK